LVDEPNPVLVSVFEQEEDLVDGIEGGAFLFTRPRCTHQHTRPL